MSYCEKYLKYKKKYINAKTIMIGRNKGEIIMLIDKIFNLYSEKIDLTIKQRLEYFNDGFNKILDLCKKYYEIEAKEYYKKRNKKNDELEEIQQEIFKELQNAFIKDKNISVHKTSSFAAKTYVLGESDIDFTICIKSDIKTSGLADYYKKYGDKILIPLGYKYLKMYDKTEPREVYQIFTKYINGIEIEVKIRDYSAFKPLLRYHDYMNDKCPKKKKILITYIKFLLSNPSKIPQYSKFKWIMMEFGLYNNDVMKVFGKIGMSDTD